IIPVTIILGRFFCGWMCAFGSFGDFIFGFAKKVFHVRYRIDETSDRVLKFVKYGMLAFAIAFLWIYNVPGLTSASPWDVFGMLATVGTIPNLSFVLSNLMLGFIFFILIAIGSAFIQRFFCRYFCPLGAVFTILTLLRISRIVKPTRKCGNCRVCTNQCAMGIPLYKKESVHSGECIECLQCVSACPRHNINYHIAGSDVRPLVAGTLAAIVITGIYSTADLAFAQTNDTAAATTVAEASEAPSMNAGSVPSATSGRAAASSAPGATPAASQKQNQATASAKPSASASQSAKAATGYKDGTYAGTGMGFRG
ncbi:MAG: 4Fe-4S binding protein, partial [Eubacteriales bacterium]